MAFGFNIVSTVRKMFQSTDKKLKRLTFKCIFKFNSIKVLNLLLY